MDIEVRPLERDRVPEAIRMLFTTFGEQARQRDVDLEERVLGDAAWVGAFDDGTVVGSAASTTLRMTVPGSETDVAAVTSVGVLPTHRRRGALTSLMRRQLDDLHEADVSLAALWSSEAGIYPRFGYGLAIPTATFSIERPETAFARDVPPAGRVRLLERDAVVAAFAPVYDRVRARRPGFFERDERWWNYLLEGPHDGRGHPTYFALHEGPDGADGFARYRIERKWSDVGPASVLELDELVAASDAAYAALWRYVFDVDLIRTVRGENRPPDEPLFHLLVEPRGLRLTLRDGVWLRLVDVPLALASRRYRAPGRVVVEVRDAFCPWNEGRFELEGGPDGAVCRETDRDPDLLCDAADLAAIYMGGVKASTLLRAGRILEETPNATQRVDEMFSWGETPWCPNEF